MKRKLLNIMKDILVSYAGDWEDDYKVDKKYFYTDKQLDLIVKNKKEAKRLFTSNIRLHKHFPNSCYLNDFWDNHYNNVMRKFTTKKSFSCLEIPGVKEWLNTYYPNSRCL